MPEIVECVFGDKKRLIQRFLCADKKTRHSAIGGTGKREKNATPV
jgi:hypothetical protein